MRHNEPVITRNGKPIPPHYGYNIHSANDGYVLFLRSANIPTYTTVKKQLKDQGYIMVVWHGWTISPLTGEPCEGFTWQRVQT